MHTYKWQEKFYVGVEGIDQEHKNLLTCLNKLIVAQRLDKAIMLKLANEVILYARFHFMSEENLMYLLHYPQIAEHSAIHRKVIKELENKRKHLEESTDSLPDFINYLVQWFIEHTQTTDREFAAYVNEYKAPKGSPEYMIRNLEVSV